MLDFNIAELAQKQNEHLVLLSTTKRITESDTNKHPEWKHIQLQYKACINSTVVPKSVCSILNSIFHQQRLVFGLTRNSLRELLTNDENWIEPLGLSNDNYKKIIGFLIKNKFIEVIPSKTNSNREVLLFKVIYKDIINSIKVDINQQLIDATYFIQTDKKHKVLTEAELNKQKEDAQLERDAAELKQLVSHLPTEEEQIALAIQILDGRSRLKMLNLEHELKDYQSQLPINISKTDSEDDHHNHGLSEEDQRINEQLRLLRPDDFQSMQLDTDFCARIAAI